MSLQQGLRLLQCPQEDFIFPESTGNGSITSEFQISSIAFQIVSYRVRTTAPKRYMFRPANGFLVPGEQVTIKVTMNLSKYPKLDHEPDKFQIQALLYTSHRRLPRPEDDNFDNFVKEVWRGIPDENIFRHRILVFGNKAAKDFKKNSGDVDYTEDDSERNSRELPNWEVIGNGSGDLGDENKLLRSEISKLRKEIHHVKRTAREEIIKLQGTVAELESYEAIIHGKGLTQISDEELHRLFTQFKKEKKKRKMAKIDAQLCVVCTLQPRSVAILPCGHMCMCAECGPHVDRCPLCRQDIQELKKIFL